MRIVLLAVLLLCLLLLLPLPHAAAKRRAKGSSPKERRKERKAAEVAKLTQEELWAQEDEAMPAYNGALDAEDAGDLAAAEEAYRDAIKVAPAWVAPAMNRAVLLNSLRRTKEAISQYEALLNIHKNHAQAMFNLANAHRSIDELDKAKDLYRRVIVQSWTEAGSNEGKARESNMLPAASTNLGNVLQIQGHYEEAVAQHRMAFNLSPETPDAIFNLGVSLIGMGGMGLDEAPAIWSAAVQRDSQFLLRLTNGGLWVPEMLEEEAGAVQAVAEQSAEEVGDGEEGKARREKMPALVASLRMTESNVGKIVNRFTGIFWQDREATIKRPIESIDERSMAYGSTPFQSWHEIVMHPTLQTALLRAAKAPAPPPPPPGVSLGEAEAPRGFVVLGSSIGWFPMLAYLQFGTPSVGYELLMPDVEEAERIQRKYKIPRTKSGVRFVHGDAREVDMTAADIIWLNDAVWSIATRSAVYAKMAQDLRLGTLVVDYHDSLVNAIPDSPFEMVAELTVPTSWSMNTRLYLMRNRGVVESGEKGPAQQAHEPEGEASWHEEI